MTRLVFVEFPEHAAEAAAIAARDRSVIVAWTPHVAVELERLGVAYTFPEDHFDWRRVEDDGIAFIDDLRRLLTRVDGILREHVPDLAAENLDAASLSLYEAMLLLGSVWLKVRRAALTVAEARPEAVTTLDMPRRPFVEGAWDDALHGPAVAEACLQAGIPATRLERPVTWPLAWFAHPPEPPPPHLRPAALRRLGDAARGRLGLVWRRLTGRRVPRLLVVQSPVPPALLRARCDVVPWPGPADPAGPPRTDEIGRAWRAVQADAGIRAFFTAAGFDWFGLATDRLQHLVESAIMRSLAGYHHACAVLGATRPDALLVCHLYGRDLRTAALAARRRGVPVICEPHGPYGHYLNHVFPLVDSLGASHYLVGGPGAVDFTRRHCPTDMELVVTGAAMMDQARAPAIGRRRALRALGLDPARPTVVVAIQPMAWALDYPPYVIRDDRRTWSIEREILRALASRPDVQIVLKGHPATDYPVTPLAEYGARTWGERFRYVAGWPLTDLLDSADAFVLGYAVTTIYQVLARRRRVYLSNDFYQVDPPHRSLLENAAYSADTVDGLLAMLKRDLDSGDMFTPSDRDPEAFLRAFASPAPDRRNRARMIAAIAAIASPRCEVSGGCPLGLNLGS